MKRQYIHFPPKGCDYEESRSWKNIWLLQFPKEWIGTHLPLAPLCRKDYDLREVFSPEAFEIELLDAKDGKIYFVKTWAAYEEGENGLWQVHHYMFAEHYCACNRKLDASKQGAVTDDECEGDRFKIRSITAPATLPDVLLYTETERVGRPAYPPLYDMA